MKTKSIRNFFINLTTISFVSLFTQLFYINPLLKVSANVIFTKEKSFDKEFYLLGPGDEIAIDIYSANEYSGNYIITKSGNVNFPLIGTVNLTNLTIREAVLLVQNKFSNQLIRPELNIRLLKPRPVKISIIGEVKRPGFYTMIDKDPLDVRGKPTYLPTIIDAIQISGGITKNANLNSVIISRKLPGKNNNYKKGEVNLLDLIFNGNHLQNTILYDGDIIQLKKAKDIPSDVMNIAAGNLSPKNINVTVIGKVENPANIQIPANTALNQAILIAGGPTAWKANTGNVELVRLNRNGTISKRKFKLDLSADVSDEYNPPLFDNDIIRVRSSFISNLGDGLVTITKPLSNLVTAVTLYKLLED